MDCAFERAGNGDFYVAEIPGMKLREAQVMNVAVPIAGSADSINLSTIKWYDDRRTGPGYHKINELEFNPDILYTVRYVFFAGGEPCRTAYLFAVPTVLPFARRTA